MIVSEVAASPSTVVVIAFFSDVADGFAVFVDVGASEGSDIPEELDISAGLGVSDRLGVSDEIDT